MSDDPTFADTSSAQAPESAASTPQPIIVLEPRVTRLTTRSSTVVRRTLPHRDIRMIGAWCFVDHYGPDKQSDAPMWVGPHPHTGLQTVTWLFTGDVEHRDSVGSVQRIHPGQLNLMTAGYGISHAEVAAGESDDLVHGVQLWVALPDDARNSAPHFAHHQDLPTVRIGSAQVTVFMGTYGDVRSPAEAFTPLVGAQVGLPAGSTAVLPLNPSFEHGLLVASGDVTIDGTSAPRGALVYLPQGRRQVTVTASSDTTLILVGGEPFDEQIVMWWNFIGRTHEEILAMREQWQTHADRFGTVAGYDRPTGTTSRPSEAAVAAGAERPGWIPAPEVPSVRLQARGRRRA